MGFDFHFNRYLLMTRTKRTSRKVYRGFILGSLLIAACSKGDDTTAGAGAGTSAPAASNQSAAEELADVASYRLTMDKFDKYYAAQRNIMLKAKDMSAADKAAMKARSDARDNNASMDDMVRNIESEPVMKEAIREAGMSPREFAMFTMAMMQSAMAAGVAKMRPNDNQDSLIRAMQANPENVKFMVENEATIASKQKELEAEMKRLGMDDES